MPGRATLAPVSRLRGARTPVSGANGPALDCASAMTRGPLYEFLQRDHARLDELLRRSDATPAIDHSSYESFRGGLLRHIAMEEKVLLPEARRIRGGEPLALTKEVR